ncbi:MAG: glutathione peroxidase [Dysgonamonadaceae bacterium]|jgi:glutathione peroxidase|nr:glutathione peroxidase [Dysgonamonadaceae bacterium]
MKWVALFIMSIFLIPFGKTVAQNTTVVAPAPFYDLQFTGISGKPVDFDVFKGKYVLIVNTASKCGYTPQFKDLEELYQQYKEQLVVVGFPSNDFGAQDPGSNKEIEDFCRMNYGVSFLMMEKSPVKGDVRNLVYQWLTDDKKNGWNTQEPTWNFCKYLIDPKGNLVAFYPSKVKPASEEITGVFSR